MSRRATVALVACLLAAACSDAQPVGTSAARTEPPTTVTAAPADRPEPSKAPAVPSAGPTPAFPARTGLDQEAALGGPLSVVAVRVANQDGYDRVVFELKGRSAGAPGWRVEYVDNPTQDGSGEPVDVGGDATLAVRIEGAGYPGDTGFDYAETVDGPGATEMVEDVELGAVFEGVYEAWIGTSRKAPFRVFRLENPARVVVDVRHD
jgi:hypothetical protein